MLIYLTFFELLKISNKLILSNKIKIINFCIKILKVLVPPNEKSMEIPNEVG